MAPTSRTSPLTPPLLSSPCTSLPSTPSLFPRSNGTTVCRYVVWACVFEVRQFTVLPVSGNVCVAGLVILYGLQVSGRTGPGGGPFEYSRITHAVLDMIFEHRRSDLILHTEYTRVTPNLLVNECVLINMRCYTHSLIPCTALPAIPMHPLHTGLLVLAGGESCVVHGPRGRSQRHAQR